MNKEELHYIAYKLNGLKTDNLEVVSIDGEYCDVVYHGSEYKKCKIEPMKDNHVFIGLPAHWWFGEYCEDYEEGPIINLDLV